MSLVNERNDAAGRSLATFDRNREGTDQAAATEHLLDVAAHVLHMQDPARERHPVHDEDVVLRKNLLQLDSLLTLEATRGIGTLEADRGVHRVVGRPGVKPGPGELHLHQPLCKLAVPPRMTQEIALLVLPALPLK